jgi:hypothetical protein
MADEKPQSRPEPKQPGPPIYGGEWGSAGKQNAPEGEGKPDRPGKIEPSKEPRTPGET